MVMSINTNIQSLVGQSSLAKNQQALAKSLTALSTGVRINKASDDPAGVVSSATLKSEMTGIQTAITNSTRAQNMINTADAALGQMQLQLNDMQALFTGSANTGVLSDEEIAANQKQIDASVQTINRIAASTSFAGKNLLDGSLAVQHNGTSATFSSMNINSANFNASGANIDLAMTLTQAATVASMSFGTAFGSATGSFVITGNRGSSTINITTTAASEIASAINAVSDVTGVSANAAGYMNSFEWGSDQLVRVSNGLATSEDYGSDAQVDIAGQTVTGRGLDITYTTSNVNLSFSLTSTIGGGSTGANIASLTLTGGSGARFQLGGDVNSGQQLNLSFNGFFSSQLGGTVYNSAGQGTRYSLDDIVTGGQFALTTGNGNAATVATAASIVDSAITQIANQRAYLGSVSSRTIGAGLEVLQVANESISAAFSTVYDTDFAKETSNLSKYQILSQSSLSTLQIANSQGQSVLSLLGG